MSNTEMKFAIFIFTIFFILGICSSIHYKQKDEIYQFDKQRYNRNENGLQNGRLEDNDPFLTDYDQTYVSEKVTFKYDTNSWSEQMPHSIEEIGSKIHDTIVDKFFILYDWLQGTNKSHIVNWKNLPKFADPLLIEFPNKNFLNMINATFQNVQLRGLSNFNKSELNIDNKKKMAILILYANEMLVTGEYITNNFFSKYSGNFHLNLYNTVTFVEKYIYELQGSTVNIVSFSGKFDYGKLDSTYENIGFLTKLFEGTLNNILMDWIESKVENEINNNMKSQVISKISEYQLHGSPELVTEFWQIQLKIIRTEIWNKMMQGNYSTFELYDNLNENIKYENYVAKILSIYLSGLDRFQLKLNEVEIETNVVTVKVILSVKPIQGNLTFSLKNTNNLKESFQGIVVPFTGDEMRADIDMFVYAFGKFPKISTSVNMSVQNIAIQTFTNQSRLIQKLISNRLTGVLKNTIIEHIGNLIEKEIKSILVRGNVQYVSAENKSE